MRRTDREVTDMDRIIAIIDECDVCTISFFDDEYPYSVTLNFGYSYESNELILYFHGAYSGKKLDLDRRNKVAFEMHNLKDLIIRSIM